VIRRAAGASATSCTVEKEFGSFPVEERAQCLRDEADSGHQESGTTSGLLAYLPRRRAGRLSELHVGTIAMLADAGLTEVSQPTLRRVVMRRDR
jgi:hypothetical protein